MRLPGTVTTALIVRFRHLLRWPIVRIVMRRLGVGPRLAHLAVMMLFVSMRSLNRLRILRRMARRRRWLP